MVKLISNMKQFLRRLTEEEEGNDGDYALAATSTPATAASDSVIVEEEGNAWYSQFCHRKSGEGGTAANTTRDTIRTQVRAFKEKRLRRLESIERDDAKGTSRPSDEIAAGVTAHPPPPPPRSDEKLRAPPSDDERKPPPSPPKERGATIPPPPPPPPRERVATDDRGASSSAMRDRPDRKPSRRRRSQKGVSADTAREMVARIESGNLERRRRSAMEAEEAKGGYVPAAKVRMW